VRSADLGRTLYERARQKSMFEPLAQDWRRRSSADGCHGRGAAEQVFEKIEKEWGQLDSAALDRFSRRRRAMDAWWTPRPTHGFIKTMMFVLESFMGWPIRRAVA